MSSSEEDLEKFKDAQDCSYIKKLFKGEKEEWKQYNPKSTQGTKDYLAKVLTDRLDREIELVDVEHNDVKTPHRTDVGIKLFSDSLIILSEDTFVERIPVTRNKANERTISDDELKKLVSVTQKWFHSKTKKTKKWKKFIQKNQGLKDRLSKYFSGNYLLEDKQPETEPVPTPPWLNGFGIKLFTDSSDVLSESVSQIENTKQDQPKVKTLSDKELNRRAAEVAVSYEWVLTKSKEKEAEVFRPRIVELKVKKNLGSGRLECARVSVQNMLF